MESETKKETAEFLLENSYLFLATLLHCAV